MYIKKSKRNTLTVLELNDRTPPTAVPPQMGRVEDNFSLNLPDRSVNQLMGTALIYEAGQPRSNSGEVIIPATDPSLSLQGIGKTPKARPCPKLAWYCA
jgi:hypothetical protein